MGSPNWRRAERIVREGEYRNAKAFGIACAKRSPKGDMSDSEGGKLPLSRLFLFSLRALRGLL